MYSANHNIQLYRPPYDEKIDWKKTQSANCTLDKARTFPRLTHIGGSGLPAVIPLVSTCSARATDRVVMPKVVRWELTIKYVTSIIVTVVLQYFFFFC